MSVFTKLLLALVVELFLLFPSASFAGTFVAFGPQSYQRQTGSPVTVTNSFSVLNPNTTYTIRINNGGLTDGEFEKVSSSVISLNRVQIVGPDEFNQNVSLVEKPVTLGTVNELAVELRGQLGGGITIQITGADDDAPSITVSRAPPANIAGWNNTDVTVSFTCTDATSGIASCPAPITATAEGANQVVSGTAVDLAGNTASTSVTLNIDKTPPSVAIFSPSNGATLNASPVTVSGTITESLSGIVDVTCNGIPVALSASNFTCDVSLTEGLNSITVEAIDLASNRGVANISVEFRQGPIVSITSPANLTLFNSSPITVSGTVNDSSVTVVVNGVPATISGGIFTATGVPLKEGSNLITVTATDSFANTGTSSITVALDTTPPTVLIDFPPDGAILAQPSVTVTGMINDIVTGTVNGDDAIVTVNGIDAQISNRNFIVTDLPLRRGPNTITARATDKAGNISSTSVNVTFQQLAGQKINLISGNNQTGIIGTTLLFPLVVSLTGATGNPVPGRVVTFKVTRGNGGVRTATQEGRNINVVTDTAGQAQVLFTLGTSMLTR